jgi:hypothetical protein
MMRGLTPQLPGATIEVAGGFNRPPMERTAGVAKLFDLAWEAGSELGQSIKEGTTGGGSDGNFTAALGIPTLDGLGALGDGAHALHEHVLVSGLVPRAALMRPVAPRPDAPRLFGLTGRDSPHCARRVARPHAGHPLSRSRPMHYERRQKAALSCPGNETATGAIRGSPVFSAVTLW